MSSSSPSQEEVDDILGAALDALEDLDDGGDQSQAEADALKAAAAPPPPPAAGPEPSPAPVPQPTPPPKKVYYGPEPPPPEPPSSAVSSKPTAASSTAASSSPSASLEDAMAQLLRAGEALQSGAGGAKDDGDISNIDLDGAEKMLDELMGKLQLGDLGEFGNTNSSSTAEGGQSGGSGSNDGQKKKEKGDGGTTEAKAASKAGSSNGGYKANSFTTASGGGAGTDCGADVDRAVKRLLSDMAKAKSSDDIPNMDAMDGSGSQMEAMGEDMMESMMKELSAFGSTGDADDVVDGMMKQLLSKELMYDPMKQVCDRFPSWLAESKGHLSEEEYQK